MITIGAKFFFGLATLALFAAGFYWWSSHLEFFGVIVLLSFAVASAFLGGMIMAFRDADAAAPAIEATSPADAEGISTSRPLVSPSIWPIVGGFGAVLTAIGLIYDRRWFVGGLLVLVATTVEWAVQAWSDRASDDPAYNSQIRGRLMHPLEFPVLGALSVIVVIFGFSRVMLAIPKDAAIVVFICIGALVLLVATLLASRHRVSSSVIALALVVGGVGVLAGGVAGATKGERTFEHHTSEVFDPNKKTSNQVANKASVFALVEATSSGLNPDSLTIPRSTPSNLLFENKDSAPRNLVVEAGTQPKTDANGKQVKDANGNVIQEPVTYHTDVIGNGKAQILTVTMPYPGTYTFRSQGGSGELVGKIVVP
jgi:hypothetical protein